MNQKSDHFFQLTAVGLTIFGIAATTGCSSKSNHSNQQSAPVISDVQISQVGLRSTVDPNVAPSQTIPEIKVQITLDKSAIAGREFLYGADLQYSNFHDPGFDLDNQSMAIGHIPATFRIVGKELQLVADNKRLSASDVDHPELLISRYKIIAQTDKTLTVSGANSAVFLAQVFEGTKSGTPGALSAPAGTPPRDSWIRSFDYAKDGNYLLQQTSIVTADGTRAEFMESVFPRDNLKPGDDFLKLPMDPITGKVSENVSTSDELNRFRFLAGETIYEDAGTDLPRISVGYAQHFDLSSNATIDWYVTQNAPDSVLPALKNAVEGWNRYFQAFFKRDVVQFKGRLPQGIYIGDPRYNVINWDSKRVAGAAYESQAADPDTGRQSHSVIYMPAAWLQIGLDYWKDGDSSDPVLPKNKNVLSPRFACMREVQGIGSLVSSGRLSLEERKVFSVQLLKQTLFHEVGHALGLAHNFKGSLSYDLSKPGSMFSTSIMDYNDYEIERAAFKAVDSSEGPLLEYDRQALSAIYNESKDIQAGDPTLPVCADEEADAEDGGIDPLCIRYDIEKDPTLSVNTALDRVNLATKPGDTTLAEALARVPSLSILPADVAAAQTEEEVEALTLRFEKALMGPVNFYYYSGKASVAKAVKTNVKTLLDYEEAILPADYSAAQMRIRAFSGIQKTLAMTDLSEAAKTGLKKAQETGLALIAQTPYVLKLSSADQQSRIGKLRSQMTTATTEELSAQDSIIAKTRIGVAAALSRHPKVSFSFITDAGATPTSVDYEKDIIGLLSNLVTKAPKRSIAERVGAAKTLMSFKSRMGADDALEAALKAATEERASALTSETRDDAQSLMDVLNPKKAAD